MNECSSNSEKLKKQKCLDFKIKADASKKVAITVPKGHEIVGVEGKMGSKGIISLSLIFWGPALNILTDDERKDYIDYIKKL